MIDSRSLPPYLFTSSSTLFNPTDLLDGRHLLFAAPSVTTWK